ncbi:MBL fold metallo-hydrolase [Cohnella sp. WQ 127256]|uniref:MBL fold metallo-hydrolase n=1 Tax=Cohnella sp. WQ 127256 TaxID=2938790 RepID=UPI002118FCAF|nr:MBL fold metallo-hydrolase [Cohnella sp. WQ 127256]
MKVRFLGTAAFEGIPALFCGCELCKKAMELGGENIRTRTSVMLGDDLKVDFPPDTYTHMIRDRLDLDKVQDLILTHSHSDHLYAEDLVARLPGYSKTGDHPIQIYGNDLTIAKCKQMLDAEGGAQGKFVLNRVRPYDKLQLQTSRVVPLPAAHDPNETCLLYYIEKDDKTILYGHDTGTFPDETWEWLKDKKFDLVILECTVGHVDYQKTHMNIEAVLETKSTMVEYGMLKPVSEIVVTHFSHNAQLLHADLVDIFEPHSITVAFDGMVLEV